MMSLNYKISPIVDGLYEVTIDLSKWFYQSDLYFFERVFKKIADADNDFRDICTLNNSLLKYKSESLFPTINNPQKKKIVIVLGNPATHSIVGGMFFYSRSDGTPHQFWYKLEKSGLMSEVRSGTLQYQALRRKQLILNGMTSSKYLLGLTTFYSFPTPVQGEYKDVKGVETLFRLALSKVRRMELDRIISYEFSKDSLFVFTQQSSYRYAVSHLGENNVIYWRLRGAGSSGIDLRQLLEKHVSGNSENE